MSFLTGDGVGYKAYEWKVKGGWLYRDDEKFFPNIVHYPAIYNDTMRAQRVIDVPRIRQAGFNGMHAPVKCANFSGTGVNHDDNLLHTLHRLGMFAIISNNDAAGWENSYSYFAPHPAVFGVSGYDDVQNVSPPLVLEKTIALKAQFPNRLVYNTGGTSGNMTSIAGYQDVLAFQRYPVIEDNGTTCYESLASITSNLVPALNVNMVSNSAMLINTQAFKWYDYETWVTAKGETKVVGNPKYRFPTEPTEPHYRSGVYQALIAGCTGISAYAWADWVFREAGLTQENNLTTNTELRNGVTRVNAELASFMPYIKHGDRFQLLMPPESYAACWLYQGKILVLACNGKASTGTISTTNECPFSMQSKPRPMFQHVPSASLTNTDKRLTFTNIPWNASEAYVIDLAD